MACVEITPATRQLLDSLRSWPPSGELLEQLRGTAEWEQARAWGWVLDSGELTGSGSRHLGEQPTGILPPHL